MAYESNFRLDDFELYNACRNFRKKVYQLIRQLPTEEKYCLANQMRRAAVSVSNNIAEGHGRWYYQESIRFCRISRGSVEELIDDFNVCLDEEYGETPFVEHLKSEADLVIARINSYISYLRRSKQGTPPETR
ncbi:four helix bundle protein [Aeoliella straminimaris]|uniref:four helix bundle protein n=1 Tax=Aeoliella straminimaris TaxID=2954799 RepID=UPI003CC6DAB5